MGKIDYKIVLKRLIEDYPHDIEKIERVLEDYRKENPMFTGLTFKQIIVNEDWSADEKYRLLLSANVFKNEPYVEYEKKNNKIKNLMVFYTIDKDNMSGFKAIIKNFKNVESFDFGRSYKSKKDYICDVVNYIVSYKDNERIADYINIVLDELTDEEIKEYCKPYYVGNMIDIIFNYNLFSVIIKTKNLDLIERCIPYIDDINAYMPQAVATKSIDVVKYFIDKGADVNYISDSILRYLTPIKEAIKNNDYEMYKFLKENGADITLSEKIDSIDDIINNVESDLKINGLSDYLKRPNIYKENGNNLLFKKVCTPLEYALKLSDNYKNDHNYINYKVDNYKISDKNGLINRMNIINDIYDSLNNKENVNYTDMLVNCLICSDIESFKKYTKIVNENKTKLDTNLIYDAFFYMEHDKNEVFTDELMTFINENNLKYKDLYSRYKEFRMERFFQSGKIKINYFITKFLENMYKKEKDDLINLNLITLCSNLDTLKELLKYGYKETDTDDNGKNLLETILSDYKDMSNEYVELYNYLVDKVDLNHKDNKGHNALYYALETFSCATETRNLWYTKDGEIFTKKEEIAIDLIKRMNKEDIDMNMVSDLFDKRMNDSESRYSNHGINLEKIYHHHRDLFRELIKKGYKPNNNFLKNLFNSLYDQRTVDQVKKRIDYDKTLNFVYTTLDINTEIQDLSILDVVKNCNEKGLSKDSSYEEYKNELKVLGKSIKELKSFYNKNIKKKFDKKNYLKYVWEKYRVTYLNLEDYLIHFIISGLVKYGNDKISEILSICPKFDINGTCEGEIGLNYLDIMYQIEDPETEKINEGRFYSDGIFYNENGNVSFNGGLLQYAVLSDDLDLVKYLESKGAKFDAIEDEYNTSRDYVTSCDMEKYVNIALGDEKYKDFDENTKAYYLSLIG